jgi:6-pyruvoyltetrahydropterin/6-carboxytetrahydropterin synthase
MGHTLHNYEGNCANLHGHNYCLIVTICNDVSYTDPIMELDVQGMVMDFGMFKGVVTDILDTDYDHRFLIYEGDKRAQRLKALDPTVSLVPFNPTAEMLAYTIKNEINSRLTHFGDGVFKVTNLILKETENSHAEI